MVEIDKQLNIANGSNANGVNKDNVSSSLYMHFSNNLGALLVLVHCDEMRFRLWKRDVFSTSSLS